MRYGCVEGLTTRHLRDIIKGAGSGSPFNPYREIDMTKKPKTDKAEKPAKDQEVEKKQPEAENYDEYWSKR